MFQISDSHLWIPEFLPTQNHTNSFVFSHHYSLFFSKCVYQPYNQFALFFSKCVYQPYNQFALLHVLSISIL